ncbi:MAG: hypothetical protein ACLU37_06745 [Collinsella sp.]
MSDIWIDSLALSRIALPRLASHKLSFMADLFGCDSVSTVPMPTSTPCVAYGACCSWRSPTCLRASWRA